MKTGGLILQIFLMAAVTYLIRALPIVFLRKKIRNRFFQSFLHYLPYAVLTAMTYPAILSATDSVFSALFGFLAACVCAWFGMGLLPTALISCAAVFITELFIK